MTAPDRIVATGWWGTDRDNYPIFETAWEDKDDYRPPQPGEWVREFDIPATEYVRADLAAPSLASALEVPEVRALVEALREIAGMDLMGASAVAYNALRQIGGGE